MKHRRPAALEFFSLYAFFPHGEHLQRHLTGLIDLPDFFVGRIFQGIDTVSSKHLHIEAIEVFRPGTNKDGLWRYLHVAAPGQVGCQRFPELHAAFIGRRIQNLFSVIGKYISHGPGKGRKGKQIPFPFIPSFHHHPFRQAPPDLFPFSYGIGIAFLVNHIVPAPLPGLHIPLLGQKLIGMLHCNDAVPRFISQLPLGRKPIPFMVNPAGNFFAKLGIKFHVAGHGYLLWIHCALRRKEYRGLF